MFRCFFSLSSHDPTCQPHHNLIKKNQKKEEGSSVSHKAHNFSQPKYWAHSPQFSTSQFGLTAHTF